MKHIGALSILAMLALLSRVEIAAQSSTQPSAPGCQQNRVKCAYQKSLNTLVTPLSTKSVTDGNRKDAIKVILAPWTEPDVFVLALTGQNLGDAVLQNIVTAWQRARVDQQIGPSSQSSGATDLVSRPSASDLLGLAVQLGALTETVSGTTATFQANAEGAYRALLSEPVICPNCAPTGALSWRNLNTTLSFDLNSQGTKTATTSGPANSATQAPSSILLPQSIRRFSSLDVKYDIHNPIDPKSSQFQKAWKTAFSKHSAGLSAAATDLDKQLLAILDPLNKDSDGKIAQLQATYQVQIKDAATAAAAESTTDSAAKLYSVVDKFFQDLVVIARADVPNLDQKVAAAVAAFARYSEINYSAVEEAAGSQFTAEYTYNHPQSQPDTHDFKLIYGLTPKSVSGTLFTLNLVGSLYGGELPAGAKYGRVRDFQFAAQLDRPIGDRITHPATFTLAGYVQYQFDPSVLNIGPGNLAPGTSIMLPGNAQVLLGTKGTLGIVQAKLTLDTKSGFEVPVAVSWANKTDLLNATDVRGHVGITYNFDSISQIFGH